MKRISQLLFSPKTTLVLLLVFAAATGAATFIEDKYDINTAQQLVYRANWFNVVIGLMALNFMGNIKRYHLFSWAKAGGFLFHAGFVLLIVGAAITRFFGFEGMMHIREGETASAMQSVTPYLQVRVSENNKTVSVQKPVYLTQWGSNDFSYSLTTPSGKKLDVSFNQYLKSAQEKIVQQVPDGEKIIAIQLSAGGGAQVVYLKQGEQFTFSGHSFSYGDAGSPADIQIADSAATMKVNGLHGLSAKDMKSTAPDAVQSGPSLEFRKGLLYTYHEIMFVLLDRYEKAVIDFEPLSGEAEEEYDVLAVNVTLDGQQKKLNLVGMALPQNPPQKARFGDVQVEVKYGTIDIPVPFSLHLNDFSIERYAGSMSPASFASDITLVDSIRQVNRKERIFMNNVLDYQGYRFFQSSYDTDEMGTILSVSHDAAGTRVTYLSYLVLFFGFVVTLFSRHSRFRTIGQALSRLQAARKAAMLVTGILISGMLHAQEHNHSGGHVIPEQHAEAFGKILVQTSDGRIEPLQTLAFDLLHKISRKDIIETADRGSLNPMQVLIDILADPEYWKGRKFIYVREQAVADLIGIEGKAASFNDFIDPKGQYKLSALVDEAFRKSPATQNKFDKELIKVDERVNLFYMMLQGAPLKLFPADPQSRKWVDWNDSLAHLPLGAGMGIIQQQLDLKEMTYNALQTAYLQALMSGTHSGNYSRATEILGYIKSIQLNSILAKEFPSDARIEWETRYNRLQVFSRLKMVYALTGLVLLIFAVIIWNKPVRSKGVKLMQAVLESILLITFLVHSAGMIMRWYITGHAPWSNGYEALLLVAWSVVLAGFCFYRSALFIKAATALLAGIVLMTAGHSNYDPQLTNLQPVLQSYWLVIHVAVITISYGFLALGFMLGLLNIFFVIGRNQKNAGRMNQLITELTFVNEQSIQIGLFLATMGTFLGGVWANESWGRYWGWDAKETWALIIVMVYSIVAHLRLVPALRSQLLFNISSILAFSTVLMTFIGVNYYLSKGLHSYASDDKAVFPAEGWIAILAVFGLIIWAIIKERRGAPAPE